MAWRDSPISRQTAMTTRFRLTANESACNYPRSFWRRFDILYLLDTSENPTNAVSGVIEVLVLLDLAVLYRATASVCL